MGNILNLSKEKMDFLFFYMIIFFLLMVFKGNAYPIWFLAGVSGFGSLTILAIRYMV